MFVFFYVIVDMIHRKMKIYKRYVMNQAYLEGSITECCLMDKSMMYVMNYMPNGTKGSHKQVE